MAPRHFAAYVGVVATILAASCGDDVERQDPNRIFPSEGGSGPVPTADKIDLLLVIDNAPGMADAQALLALTVPHLVADLAATGIRDVHLGVVSASLGSHGSDTCLAVTEPSENDAAHLLARTVDGEPVATWSDLGFLVWDPDPNAPSHAPQGESDPAALSADLAALVLGAGDRGCGYQAPLEAWYRFLVDPDPHEVVEVEGVSAVMKGTDATILLQRRDFLRPSSLLAIVIVSDDNDCSIRDGGQYYFAAQQSSPGTTTPYHLPKPRPECSASPGDPCCRSCGQSQEGCPDVSPHCDANGDGKIDTLDPLADAHAVRCFDQKRRFGIDFLYPMDRYVTGLTSPQVADRNGNLQANPLFLDLDLSDHDSGIRTADMVFVAGIVGVPWQLVTRTTEPVRALTADVLQASQSWKGLIGDPAAFEPPHISYMVESIDPRSGLPTAATPLSDQVNGHEIAFPARDALQNACIFDVLEPRDCTSAPCACQGDDSPLCYDADADVFDAVQRRGGARPGLRQLELLRSLGARGIVGSICPPSLDPTVSGFAYRPVVTTLVDRLEVHLP